MKNKMLKASILFVSIFTLIINVAFKVSNFAFFYKNIQSFFSGGPINLRRIDYFLTSRQKFPTFF